MWHWGGPIYGSLYLHLPLDKENRKDGGKILPCNGHSTTTPSKLFLFRGCYKMSLTYKECSIKIHNTRIVNEMFGQKVQIDLLLNPME